MAIGDGGDARRRPRQVARSVGRRNDERDTAVALLATVEQTQDGLDDPARVLMIVERDRTLVEPGVRVGCRVLTGHHAVTPEILVGEAIPVHVPLERKRVRLRRCVETEWEVPIPARRSCTRVGLTEAATRPLVERAVDQYRL